MQTRGTCSWPEDYGKTDVVDADNGADPEISVTAASLYHVVVVDETVHHEIHRCVRASVKKEFGW